MASPLRADLLDLIAEDEVPRASYRRFTLSSGVGGGRFD